MLLGIQLAYDVHTDGVSDTSNLYILGTVRHSRNSTNKLTVAGDLRSLNDELSFATIEVGWSEYVDGELKTPNFG